MDIFDEHLLLPLVFVLIAVGIVVLIVIMIRDSRETKSLRNLRDESNNIENDSALIIQQKQNYERIIHDKEISFQNILADKEAEFQKLSNEKDIHYEKLLEEKDRFYKSIIDDKEKNFQFLLDQQEKSFSQVLTHKEETERLAFSRMEIHHTEALAALSNRFEETVEKMQAELSNTTSGMLKERQTEFQESSSERIQNILRPLQDTIDGMKEALSRNSRKQDEFSGLFTAHIQTLLKHGEATRESAEKLANALRRNGRIQGEWGETVLSELLESQGLVEGIHFDTQATLRNNFGIAHINEDGKTMRPDVILHLDRTRDVIIDAKVSLSDYLDYVNASNEEEREAAAKAHVASIERHVKELARKDYSSYLNPRKAGMGYVIMFVPNTSALLLATTLKPDLWRKAMEKNVYIADEQTLFAALKMVALTWSQIQQSENHEELYRLADEMMNRVKQFMERYTEIGKKIDDANKSWNLGLSKLRDSGQSIPQTCAKIIKLGVKRPTSKTVPSDLLGSESGLTEDPELPGPEVHDDPGEDSSAR